MQDGGSNSIKRSRILSPTLKKLKIGISGCAGYSLLILVLYLFAHLWMAGRHLSPHFYASIWYAKVLLLIVGTIFWVYAGWTLWKFYESGEE
jgi:hypothetical protein